MNPMLAEIIMFAGNFAPRGWSFCDGQLLPINTNQALFSLLGTTYGGDGRTSFALPDLRGRAPIHVGRGPGLTDISLGERAGRETMTLTLNYLPNHSHSTSDLKGTIKVNKEAAAVKTPAGNNFGVVNTNIYNDITPDKVLATNSVAISGNTSTEGAQQAFSIRNPFLAINFIIAMQGVFPSRS